MMSFAIVCVMFIVHTMPRHWVYLKMGLPDAYGPRTRRYPLFMPRAVLKELIESLQSTQGVKPC